MNTFVRTFLFSLVVGLSLVAVRPAPATADDYWPGYWGWYDTTYRPYYYRQYYSGPAYPAYRYPPPPAYGYYDGPGYYGAPYGAYYGAPRAGVAVYPGGAAVRVGPMRFGWR